MRLFVAVPLPKAIKKRLEEVQKDFTEFPAKWVREENLHVTLVFIGEIQETEMQRLQRQALRLKAVPKIIEATKVTKVPEERKEVNGSKGCKPVELWADRLVILPSERKPHVLAAELAGETEKLADLAERIKKGLRETNICFSEKPFRPHITLARIKRLKAGERKALKHKVKNYALPKLGFEADRVELVESRLTPNGPIYKVVETADLCGRC